MFEHNGTIAVQCLNIMALGPNPPSLDPAVSIHSQQPQTHRHPYPQPSRPAAQTHLTNIVLIPLPFILQSVSTVNSHRNTDTPIPNPQYLQIKPT